MLRARDSMNLKRFTRVRTQQHHVIQ